MRFKGFEVFIMLFAVMAATSCKEPEGIGLEVLPDGEQMPIAWIDTFTIEARTVLFDSVPTSGLNSGTYLVGDFHDPIFGRVKSSIYTQLQLPSSDVDFGVNPKVDSVILNIAYAGAYGNTDKLNGVMRFGIYRLSEDIYEDSSYFSNNAHAYFPKPLAQFDYRPDLYSDVYDGTDSIPLPPSMRVRLDDLFGQQILNSPNLASNDDFIKEFKGLVIRSDAVSMPADNGSIVYMNMTSFASRLELYYNDTLRMDFDVDAATHTSFEHEYSQTILDAVDANNAIAIGNNTLYVQSMAGLRVRLLFPHIRELRQLGAVAINKAELVVPVDQDVVTKHGLPSSLQVTGINAGDSAVFITDFFEGIDYFGGTANDDGEYIFNIARHVQSLLLEPEETDYGLYISNSGNAVNARRGVFNGPLHSDRPLKLRMTYTIVE
ncbi:MAG: DUF4270 domain-containing protein [Bacteroidetes bacterium]|nr:MAG: DUF4270 domain-containing protein [Bacteroidota bacterium]